MTTSADLAPYFRGDKLYGDDFGIDEIRAWHDDEREGYADLGARDQTQYQYSYHALNQLHGFRHLPRHGFDHVLGFGSAYGDEFSPIASRIRRLTIVDPSDAFVRARVCGVPTTYVKPSVVGDLPFANDTFDLVVCFDVLHHIPNVGHVIRELFRCLATRGYALIREPVISMGDWTKPRHGLTKRERGIPEVHFDRAIYDAGFVVARKTHCVFPVISRLWQRLGSPAYNSPFATRADAIASRLMRWNLRYHATTPFAKLRPTGVFLVLTKQT